MRISDWSSDVCSSDLRIYAAIGLAAGDVGRAGDVGAGMMPWHAPGAGAGFDGVDDRLRDRSEEHTSELQSLMRISYAVFCLKQKNIIIHHYNMHCLYIQLNRIRLIITSVTCLR